MAEPSPNPTVVLHACLGVGHLIPMVELAKQLLRGGLAVIIAVPTPPASTADVFASSASAVAALAAANPAVSFHHLPPPDYPAPDPDPFLQMLDALRLTVPSLTAFLRTLPSVAGLVLDLFCGDALDAAASTGIPAYFYYTSSAGDLAAFLYLPHYFATTEGGPSFKDMGEKGKPRAHWSDAQTRILVSMMKEYHLSARYRGQNGWTKEGWSCMAARLNNKYPVSNFTVAQLKDREQRLKKDHNIVKSIVRKSGFGWDPDIKVPTAIDEKWKELSEDQQKWRNRPFPYYDDLYDIYDGKVAEGKCCRRTTDLQPEKRTANSSSQEHIINEVSTDFGLGSPDRTRQGTESGFSFGWEDGMNNNAPDSAYGDPGDVPENSQNASMNPEEQILENSAASCRTQRARSTEKGPEKTGPKKNKDGWCA